MPAGSTYKQPNKKYKRRMQRKGTSSLNLDVRVRVASDLAESPKHSTETKTKTTTKQDVLPTRSTSCPPHLPAPSEPQSTLHRTQSSVPKKPHPAASPPSPPPPPPENPKPRAAIPTPRATAPKSTPAPPSPPSIDPKPTPPNAKKNVSKSTSPPPQPKSTNPKPATTAAATMPPPPSSLSSARNLPPPSLPLKPRESPWCISGRSSGKGDLSVQDGALCIKYIAGQVGSISGTTFHAKPDGFPTTECEITYRVHFNDEWEWKEGGKMPGIFIGPPGAAGGNWMPDSGSARVCFKQGGAGIAYTYIPLQVCDGKDDREKLDAIQGADFAAAVQHTEKGTHVWRDGVGSLKRGQWNDVRLRVKLNDPNKKDGVLELEINGSKRSMPLVWRTSSSVQIEGISFASFFGGSSKSASAPENAVARFKDFSYKTRRV